MAEAGGGVNTEQNEREEECSISLYGMLAYTVDQKTCLTSMVTIQYIIANNILHSLIYSIMKNGGLFTDSFNCSFDKLSFPIIS